MFSQTENDLRYGFLLIGTLRKILLKIVMKLQ